MMRILLSGINGQVGWELQRTLQPLGEVIALERSRFDLADANGMRSVVRELKPTHIVNPAAYTAVDKAESEADLALAINGTAPGVLAEEARRLGALLVHFSTDYVFAGDAAAPYAEDAPTAPISSYGRSKLAGEHAIAASGCRHLIFRTAWVYGLRGHNFLRTMLRLARERDELRVVDDQHGAPTWSRMIAEATALALARHDGQQGIYHLAAAGATTWHGFAAALLARATEVGALDRVPPVRRIASAEFSTPAQRPAYSLLSCRRLEQDFGIALPDWELQLRLCLA